MEINYDCYLKDNLFFAEEILFDVSGKKICQNQIDEMDDFPFLIIGNYYFGIMKNEGESFKEVTLCNS